MPHVRLTRRYHFSAAHRLHSPALGEEANREVYGKCNNPHGHGHDYVLEVTVAGDADPRLGRLVPVEELDALVRAVVIDKMDRRNLNTEVEEFASLVPTTENLALVVARRLGQAWRLKCPGGAARVEKVRIQETRRNVFEANVEAALRPGQERYGNEELEVHR